MGEPARNRYKESLTARFVMAVFMVLFSASLLSALTAGVVMNGQGGRQLWDNQASIAELMVDLAARTDYPTDQIIAISVRDPYGAILENDKTIEGDIQFVRSGFFTGNATLVKVRGDTVRIFVKPNRTISVAALFFLAILATPIAALFFGTSIAGMLGRKVMRPINELSDAIERVASGDFSARVRVPHNPAFRRPMISFNKMAHDLDGIESLRADFVNNVSHEFRTPLSSISGYAKLLQRPNLTEDERREYAGIIAGESNRLATLASNLLRLSKLENQQIVPDRAVFSLDEQLRQAIVLLEPEWSAKDLQMDVQLDPVQYFGNEELLMPVWTNLLGNAIKFTPEGGSVAVRLIDAEDSVIARIKDSGIGMDAETLSHIYEQFYQGDASHAREGAGLGLSLVKRIVELCGGTVGVRSEPGKGTAFEVRLPSKAG